MKQQCSSSAESPQRKRRRSPRPRNPAPTPFEGEYTIREIERDSAPWFFGKDVALALGYKDTVKAVSTHCKHGLPIGEGVSPPPVGVDPQTIIIPEGDMYRLILRSKLPAAERFEAWLMDEVLPALRRTGRYESVSSSFVLDDEPQTPDGLKLRKVNTAARCFGERAGAQLWVKLGLEWVPAMASALSQGDLLDSSYPPGSVTITVSPQNPTH